MIKLNNALLILTVATFSITATAADKASVNDESVLPMYAVLYGANEIGLKSCKAVGSKTPASLDSWWTSVDKFIEEIVENEKNLKAKAASLKSEMDELVKKADPESGARIEAIQQELNTVLASIEYLRGPQGRITLAQNLIKATEAASKLNQIEDKENQAAYKKMLNEAIAKSMNIAGLACSHKVVGCDVAQKIIPTIKPIVARLSNEVYVSYAPSAEMNFNMEAHEKDINNIFAAIPKSPNAQFNWVFPLHEAFLAIRNSRINAGIICPDESKAALEKNTPNFLTKLGVEKADSAQAADIFKTYWDTTNKIIGQAGNRHEYFDYALTKLKAFVSSDEKKLNEFVATKAKLDKYMAEVKSSDSAGDGKVSGVARATASDKVIKANPSMGQDIYAMPNAGGDAYSSGLSTLGKSSGAGGGAGTMGSGSMKGASINGAANSKSRAISTKLLSQSDSKGGVEKLSSLASKSANDSVSAEAANSVSNLKTNNVALKNGQLSFAEVVKASAGEDGNKSIEIKPEETVVLDSNNINVGELVINGTLLCSNDVEQTVIRAKTIYVNGKFECGSPENRFNKKLLILLKPNPALDPKTNSGFRGLIVNRNGVLNLFGATERAGFHRITQTVNPGTTSLTLSSAVNWKEGDDVVLAPTSYDPNQAERFTVKSVSGNVVTLNSAVRFKHWGEIEKYNTQRGVVDLDQRAEVANLTRNIKIMADESEGAISEEDAAGAQIGGHVMVNRGGRAYVDGVEFYKMGQAGVMARYPFHWHLVGDAPGQFIKNSSIHKSYQRCITVHGTNKALVENNTCFDFKGHGYFFELGNEIDNVMRKNIAIMSKYPSSTKFLLASDNPANSVDKRFPAVSNFWITNPQNTITENISAGSVGTGFWMSFIPEVRAYNRASGEFDGALLATPGSTNTTDFSSNIAHSGRTGMTWDGGAIQDPQRKSYNNKNPNNPEDRLLDIVHYSPSFPPVFKNLSAYKNFESGIYFRGKTAVFDGGILADNGWGFFLAFNQIVKNFAIVGESKNNGAFEREFTEADKYFSWRQVGMVFYDGPLEADKIDFLNFPEKEVNVTMRGFHFDRTAVPFMAIGGNEKYTNLVSNLKFSPEPYYRVFVDPTSPTRNKAWIEEVNGNATRDVDGSLTGTAGGLLLSGSAYGSYDECTSKSFNGNPSFSLFKVCPPKTQSTLFWMATPDMPGTPYIMRRNDGEISYAMSEWKFIEEEIAQKNKVGFLAKNRMVSSPDFTYEILVKDRLSKGRMLVAAHMEKPNEFSPIFKLTGFGKQCSIDNMRASDSYAALKSAQDSAFYTDGNDFYFKQKSVNLFGEIIPSQFGKAQESDANHLWISCEKRIENEIIGYIDNVVEKNGEMIVNGWACDYGKDAQVDLHVYVGGSAAVAGSTMIGATKADLLSEPAVSFACGDQSGKTHRFTYTASAATVAQHKGKKMYFHGISTSGKENRAITNSGNFTVGEGTQNGPRPASVPEVLPSEGIFCSFKHEVAFRCNPGTELSAPWVSVGNGCYHKDQGETERCK